MQRSEITLTQIISGPVPNLTSCRIINPTIFNATSFHTHNSTNCRSTDHQTKQNQVKWRAAVATWESLQLCSSGKVTIYIYRERDIYKQQKKEKSPQLIRKVVNFEWPPSDYKPQGKWQTGVELFFGWCWRYIWAFIFFI